MAGKFNNTDIVSCAVCVYFCREERGLNRSMGFCRLDPPTVVAVSEMTGDGEDRRPTGVIIAKTVLPVVWPERDGCGQGQVRDEELAVA